MPIFATLTEEERKTLAGKTKRKRYDKGDVLVKPGDLLGSLFIIGTGVVSVTRASSEGEIELMRAGPGDHFGEIGLLTKAASQVTLKPLTPVSTYELAKEHLAPLIAVRPDFSDELGFDPFLPWPVADPCDPCQPGPSHSRRTVALRQSRTAGLLVIRRRDPRF